MWGKLLIIEVSVASDDYFHNEQTPKLFLESIYWYYNISTDFLDLKSLTPLLRYCKVQQEATIANGFQFYLLDYTFLFIKI